MYRPTLKNINAFDAANDQEFTFTWNGDQCFGSALMITNASTGVVVYYPEEISYGMKLSYTLPGGKLTNGVQYSAQILVYGKNGSNYEPISIWSYPIYFYCYSTPTFKFANITEGQQIGNSSYDVHLTYTQTESEPLQQYLVTLCNKSKTVIYSSGTKYSSDDLMASISGLVDNSTYYVHATGVTLHGIEFETDYVTINVNYTQPSLFSVITLENDTTSASVIVTSNVVAIDGYASSGAKFVDDTKIDTRDGEYAGIKDIIFPKNFRIDLLYNKVTESEPIFYFTDGAYSGTVRYRTTYIGNYTQVAQHEWVGTERKGYFELRVANPVTEAIYLTDYITPLMDDDSCHLYIIRKEHCYQIEVGEGEEA